MQIVVGIFVKNRLHFCQIQTASSPDQEKIIGLMHETCGMADSSILRVGWLMNVRDIKPLHWLRIENKQVMDFIKEHWDNSTQSNSVERKKERKKEMELCQKIQVINGGRGLTPSRIQSCISHTFTPWVSLNSGLTNHGYLPGTVSLCIFGAAGLGWWLFIG